MRAAPLIAFALLAAGCGSAPPTTDLTRIDVVAQAGANQNSATALDIVFVFDANSAALLPKTGPDWFARKAALVDGLATGIAVVSLQVPPAMTLSVALPKHHAKAIGVYSYANYIEPAGQAMANLTPFRRMTIGLAPGRIVYSGN